EGPVLDGVGGRDDGQDGVAVALEDLGAGDQEGAFPEDERGERHGSPAARPRRSGAGMLTPHFPTGARGPRDRNHLVITCYGGGAYASKAPERPRARGLTAGAGQRRVSPMTAFLLTSFTALFVTVNPIKGAAVFAVLSKEDSRTVRRRVAARATLIAS